MKKALILAAAAALSTQVIAEPGCGSKGCGTTPAAPAAAKAAQDVFSFLPEVVATVDGQDVKKAEVVQAVTAATQQFAQQGMSLSQLPKQFLDQYVSRAIDSRVERLILLTLAKADGITPSADLADTAIELSSKQIDKQKEMQTQMLAKMPKEQREKIEAQVKESRGMTVEEAIEAEVKTQRENMTKGIKARANDADYQKTMAVQVWVDKTIISSIEINDTEANEFYDKNPKNFTQPETVTASHILVIPEGADPRAQKAATPEAKEAAKKKIEGILAQIKGGADFGELAEKESSCPSGKQAKGSLGAFPRGQMDPAFETAAFGLEKGGMTDVVESSFGFHIIKVTDKAEAKLAKFDEVKDVIKMRLQGQKINEKVKEAVKAQRGKSEVKVNYVAPKAPSMPGMMPQQ